MPMNPSNHLKGKLLIADSGSTKTDWLLIDGQNERSLHTEGINPVLQTSEQVAGILRQVVENCPSSDVQEIHFYGAGCMGEHRERLAQLLRKAFPQAVKVEAESDLLGAARAVCGHEEGIACILGTGSNSCLYDGNGIVENIPPLGFILGDEGSGAVLGRRFLNALLKGQLPRTLLDVFYKEMNLNYADIIRRVYREPMPNRFLASLSPFIHAHLDDERVERIVVENFNDFFEKNVEKYGRKDLPVSAVGSIACAYEPYFRRAAAAYGYEVRRMLKSPIDGLRTYY